MLHGISEHIIHGVDENTPLIFFPIGGLVAKIRRKNDQIEVMRLTKHNDMQMLASQSAALDSHKEFVMAVGSGKVSRIAPLVAASENNHEGMDALAHRIYQASSDTFREGPVYNPEGFTPDERMKIEENIDAYTTGEDVPTGPPRIVHCVVMMDEIAVEKRVRWDDKTNMILGACREHSSNVPLEFSDLADVEIFFRELDAGKVHLASEATVVCFGALSRDPHMYPRPICISGTCKRERGPDQAALLRAVNAAGNNRKTHGNIIYRTVSFRGLAFAMEFMKSKLQETSPIYPLLAPLEFMNLLADKDYRHVFKTTRGLLMRKVGIKLLGFLVAPAIVKQHLIAVGNTKEHVDSLLNPNDRQSVELTYKLLKGVWDLPDVFPDAIPAFSRARVALKTFGRFTFHLVMPYICITLSLREQLVHLSTAAHLLLILFTTDGAKTDFMANQTFVNIMIMIKNVFFCVAKAKIDISDSEFFLILLGTDREEKLFGLIRTATGTDNNVDVYQLSTRASNLTEDRGPRRIKLPAIINERGDVSDKADHISPASCTGDLQVATVVPHSVWNQGRLIAERR
ncbi:hypothetical protein C8R44DRAFT_834354 [Mycena epipterygia]|nr:hypothetical protein C8R44DRAFT_834354 [Mycena epipterygia]